MIKNSIKKAPSVILCIVLIAVMALFASGCTGSNTPTESPKPVISDGDVLGEGRTVFTVVTEDLEGKETTCEIHTDVETVGEALLELGILDGEDGDYGLYIKTVNGLTLDYDADGKYWAFYIDGEYALTGVDQTKIDSEAIYSFKPE